MSVCDERGGGGGWTPIRPRGNEGAGDRAEIFTESRAQMAFVQKDALSVGAIFSKELFDEVSSRPEALSWVCKDSRASKETSGNLLCVLLTLEILIFLLSTC